MVFKWTQLCPVLDALCIPFSMRLVVSPPSFLVTRTAQVCGVFLFTGVTMPKTGKGGAAAEATGGGAGTGTAVAGTDTELPAAKDLAAHATMTGLVPREGGEG